MLKSFGPDTLRGVVSDYIEIRDRQVVIELVNARKMILIRMGRYKTPETPLSRFNLQFSNDFVIAVARQIAIYAREVVGSVTEYKTYHANRPKNSLSPSPWVPLAVRPMLLDQGGDHLLASEHQAVDPLSAHRIEVGRVSGNALIGHQIGWREF